MTFPCEYENIGFGRLSGNWGCDGQGAKCKKFATFARQRNGCAENNALALRKERGVARRNIYVYSHFPSLVSANLFSLRYDNVSLKRETGSLSWRFLIHWTNSDRLRIAATHPTRRYMCRLRTSAGTSRSPISFTIIFIFIVINNDCINYLFSRARFDGFVWKACKQQLQPIHVVVSTQIVSIIAK